MQSNGSQADYAQILEQAGVAVIRINDQGLIVHANNSAGEMFGYSVDVMLEHNISMLMPESHAKCHDDYLQHHLDTGERRIIGKGRRVQALKADDSQFPVHISIGRHEHDGDVYFTGILHDLTKLETTQDKAYRLGRIIDQASNEIYVFDSHSLRFSLINQGALKNLGYEQNELLNMGLLNINREYSIDSFRTLIEPLESGSTDRVTFQGTHTRKDGSQYDVDVVLQRAHAENHKEILAIVDDCSEKNQLLHTLQQIQKMEAIGRLTGGIAHDFNNLLTVISGNLDLIEIDSPNDPISELVAEARAATKRGSNLTARLLSFARKSLLTPRLVNLNDVVLDLTDRLSRTVGERIMLTTILDPDLWQATADPYHLDSVLTSLTLNARDAMTQGGALTIETRNRTVTPSEAKLMDLAAGNYVALTITDTGEGLDPSIANNIFEPFYCADLSTDGDDLGLSVAYGFARQSDGHLGVASEPGRGSVFTLLLPHQSTKSCSADTIPAVSALSRKKALVLLVEDEESVRKLTARRLLHMGHKVIEAADTEAAWELYQKHSDINIIFTDMIMPGRMAVIDLLGRIHEVNQKLPVIVSSGYSKDLKNMNISETASVFTLLKPYSLDDMNRTIGAALLLID